MHGNNVWVLVQSLHKRAAIVHSESECHTSQLGWGGHTATPRAATSVGAILCSVTESARATAAGRMNLVNLPAEKHSDKRTLRTAEVTFIAVSWAQRIQNYCCIQRRQNSIVGDQNLKRRNAWE